MPVNKKTRKKVNRVVNIIMALVLLASIVIPMIFVLTSL